MPRTTPTALRYAYAVLSVALATAARSALGPHLGDHDPFSIYYAAIAFTAWLGGLGPSLLALALGGLSVAYHSFPPSGSPAIAGPGDWIRLAVFAS